MLEKLELFLKKYPKIDNGKNTHSIIYPKEDMGSFTIPMDQLDIFYKLVCKSIFKNNEHFSILEKIQPICPFVIDLDFKYKDNIESRQYNSNIMKQLIQSIFTILNDFYNLSNDQQVCWIMEKETILKARKNQQQYQMKDGIHLLFPYIIAEKKSYIEVREELVKIDFHKMVQDENLVSPSNNMGEIVDKSIYKGGNWFIYGSGKENEIRYELTEILKYQDGHLLNLPIDIYKNDPLEIIKLNSVGRHTQKNVEYSSMLENRLKPNSNNNTVQHMNQDDHEEEEPKINNTKKYDK